MNSSEDLSVNERVSLICRKYFNGNVASMARASFISRTTISSVICENGVTPRYDFLKKIGEMSSPKISMRWLMTGKGEMTEPEIDVRADFSPIKYFVNVDSSMGNAQFLSDDDEKFVYISLPGYTKCFAINAYGDSMLPLIKSGEIVILSDWHENFIDWGKIYLVVTKSGYRAIKRVFPSDDESRITCKSENEKSNPPFEVLKDDLLKLYIVRGWICRETI